MSAAPSLEEQIDYTLSMIEAQHEQLDVHAKDQDVVKLFAVMDAILASLRELAVIRSVGKPDHPDDERPFAMAFVDEKQRSDKAERELAALLAALRAERCPKAQVSPEGIKFCADLNEALRAPVADGDVANMCGRLLAWQELTSGVIGMTLPEIACTRLNEMPRKAAALLKRLARYPMMFRVAEDQLNRQIEHTRVAEQASWAARERIAALEAALKDVFKLMDEGFLVRNTAGDDQSNWAIKAAPYLHRLAMAAKPLEVAGPEPRE